ncbi:MAG: prenyltransferase/squalene oxidase repeat-containing protein [Planctomycetota bacterium]
MKKIYLSMVRQAHHLAQSRACRGIAIIILFSAVFISYNSSAKDKTPPQHKVPPPPTGSVDQKQIDDAVKKGVDYLMKKKFGRGTRTIEVVILTLIHAGVETDNPILKGWIDLMVNEPLAVTYNVALKAMALELIDREKYQEQIAECAQAIVNYQALNGQWSYDATYKKGKDEHPVLTGTPEIIEVITDGTSTIKKKVTPPTKGFELKRSNKQRPNEGDNSNTHYALLGLRAAARCGITIPQETWKDAADFLVKDQLPDGGWSYSSKRAVMNSPASYGSMTVAGVVSLTIAKCYLKEDYKNDPAIQKGLDWLAKNITFNTNPGALFFNMPNWWQYYYIYGLERVGAILDIEKIGDCNWYQSGAVYLVKNQQKDGFWNQGADDRFSEMMIDTCFAILFLKRATPTLKRVTTGTEQPPEKKPEDKK